MKKALIIGINYIGTNVQLGGCINDANNIKNMLISKKYYAESQINMMTDRISKTNIYYPDRKNIISQLKELVNFANQYDLSQKVYLFLSYSGHGSQQTDTNNDETDSLDEVICPIDYNSNGFIKDDDIKSILIDQLKSNVTLFVLIDACHSGTMTDLKYLYKCDSAHTYSTDNKIGDTQCNVVMISGCRDNQLSAETYIAKGSIQGAMSASFLSNFKDNITYESLINNMRKMLKDGNYDQHPELTSGKFINVSSPVLLLSYPAEETQSTTTNQILNKIKTVMYGKSKIWKDVTSIFKNYFNSGKKVFPEQSHNSILGDPYQGIVKDLRVTLIDGRVKIFPENTYLILDDKDIVIKYMSSNIEQYLDKISKVMYGKNKKWRDVTSIFKDYFRSGKKVLQASNNLFSDPYYGVIKELRITLTNEQIKIFPENTYLSLNDGKYVAKYNVLNVDQYLDRISKVIYGKIEKWRDVTTIFKNYFRSGHEDIQVTNNLFGDPYRGVIKELRIVLSGGHIKRFPEHSRLKLDNEYVVKIS